MQEGQGISPETSAEAASALGALEAGLDLLYRGGVAIWVIAALSVVMLGIALWKTWRLSLMGAWSRGVAERAISDWQAGRAEEALAALEGRRSACAELVDASIRALSDPRRTRDEARDEATRVARSTIARAQAGLRGLELITTIAPLLGLLGTVLGMIAAFQALENSGVQADASTLAGGIWEALLTTAAGMGVAIPAAVLLTWFEGVIDSLRRDMEDMATRLFTTPVVPMARAAE